MRFKSYIRENYPLVGCEPNKQHYTLSEEITNSEIKEFTSRWKSKLKSYGVTEFDFSKHYDLRLNHERNNPPIKIEELDFILTGFFKKMGTQFKTDVENVKNHTAKKIGKNKKEIPDNEYEYTVKSVSTKLNFAFVLKQDFHKKGTAIVLPITIMRKKNFSTKKGDEVIIERRKLWI